MLTIWGRSNSSNVQKVLWAAEELGLTYHHRLVGGPYGGNDSPAYRSLNPTGLVPTLQDGDYVIWESNACIRYLATQFGKGHLWPEEPKLRGLADRWMDWTLSCLKPMGPLFVQYVRTPEASRDEGAIARALAEVTPHWSLLDRHLQNQAFLAGEDFTLGDIPAAVLVWRWFQLPLTRPELPALRAWLDRLSQRPIYQKWVMQPMS